MITVKYLNSISFSNMRSSFFICSFLVISTLAVYGQVGNHDFIAYDDELYVTKNPHIKNGLTWNNIPWAFTAVVAANWHPLTLLSHMADVKIYGMNPGGHHLTNLFFHIISTLLLFFIFKQMTGALRQSGFVAALFALHPLHTESVAQVAQRKDVLSTFFILMSILAYIQYVKDSKRDKDSSPNPLKNRRDGSPTRLCGRLSTDLIRHRDKYLLTLFCFILGLMTKPMVVTLPFILLLLDYFPLRRLDCQFSDKKCMKRQFFILIWEKMPFFFLSALLSIATFFIQKKAGAVLSLAIYPLDVRITNSLISYVSYIEKMIVPHRLTFYYPHPGMSPIWKIIGAGILILFISLSAVKTLRESPYFMVGWLWYIGTLIPVIGWVQVGGQSMADRYTYVPLIGLFIIIAWGIPDLLKKYGSDSKKIKIFITSIMFTYLSILMAATWVQAGYWRESITLFEHALEVTVNNDVVHNNLGIVLAEKGGYDEAINHYAKALQINPNYAKVHNNMGDVLLKQGKIAEAVRCYDKALRLNPDYAKAHHNMGIALFYHGKRKAAIQHFQKALRLNPGDMKARKNLKKILDMKE